MPITLTAFTAQTEWEGCTWSVPSVDELANAIAIIALGQADHVATVMHAAGLAPKPTTQGSIRSAVKLLSSSGNIAHRDGWMFQVMSWLAARVRTPGALMNAPQMIHAHKGLDGLQVTIDGAKKVVAVAIFEDKATTKPRHTVTQKVWPEFTEFEAGENEHLVVAEVTQLLRAAGNPDPQQEVSEILWKEKRRFRLSITDEISTAASQAKLFKGFRDCVPGEIERRRAEVFEVIDMRKWMDDLANEAVKMVRASRTAD